MFGAANHEMPAGFPSSSQTAVISKECSAPSTHWWIICLSCARSSANKTSQDTEFTASSCVAWP